MGKVSRAFFENVIARHLGEKRRDVVVGPANGVDVGVVRLSDGRAMISTTDPIYIVPQYGWERAAWFAFHILASDLTTSGVAPEYITMDWNLPMDIEDDQIETMLRVMDRECRKYGAAIVTGHTGRYEGCAYPMVGGATFLAIAPKDGWITADMAKDRKSTRLNSSHSQISYAVFCLKKKKKHRHEAQRTDTSSRLRTTVVR